MIVMERPSISEQKNKSWGEWFKNACVNAGWGSQHEIAEKTGFSRVQIQRWITGAVRPREDNIPEIANALHLGVNEVLRAAGFAPTSELTYEPDPDTEVIVNLFSGLSQNRQDDLITMARVWHEEEERKRTIGRVAEEKAKYKKEGD